MVVNAVNAGQILQSSKARDRRLHGLDGANQDGPQILLRPVPERFMVKRCLWNNFEDALHHAPVPREGANIGVVTKCSRGGELDKVRLAKADQLGTVGEDVRAGRNIELGHGRGISQHLVSERPDVVQLARVDEQEVVLERALIIPEKKHDPRSGFGFEGGFIKFHHGGQSAQHDFGDFTSRGSRGDGSYRRSRSSRSRSWFDRLGRILRMANGDAGKGDECEEE